MHMHMQVITPRLETAAMWRTDSAAAPQLLVPHGVPGNAAARRTKCRSALGQAAGALARWRRRLACARGRVPTPVRRLPALLTE
jgi:hypothetical protein